MLRSGARWRDCPSAYGPYTTIYNRFNRWSRQGIWFAIFEALTGSTGITGTIAIDSSTIKAQAPARLAAEKGAYGEAIGHSRDGRTTKIHALTDAKRAASGPAFEPGQRT